VPRATAQVLDVATASPASGMQSRLSRRSVVNAFSLGFVVALLVVFVVLRRRLRKQIRRNELSMTYIPW
jgi:type VI protein secretion system component VasF